MLVVGACLTKMRDFATFSLTKKNFTSMCLEREALLVFLEKDTAAEISQNNFNDLVITTQKVLFYTLINTGFEKFLCTNQPN